MTAAIHTEGLTKEFDNGRGCRDVSITVQEGEAFGFLGPNGAGKSTFVKMLVGLIYPTEGSATIFGHPIHSLEAKKRIGYLPELFRYQEWLTGEEVMRLHAKICGVDAKTSKERIPQLLDEVGLGSRGRGKIKNYSKGMQQRLGLAAALVGDPKIIFLDEPSSALDPVGRKEVRSILMKLKAEGKTIFLNSHMLEDVEAVCDQIALLNNGEILRAGEVGDVLQQKVTYRFKVSGYTPVVRNWLQEETGFEIQVEPVSKLSASSELAQADLFASGHDTVWLKAELQNEEQAGWINSLLIEQGLTLYEVGKVSGNLEDWFLTAVKGLSHRGEQDK
ncbi:ABC transporter ATP-binding protein [Paenibacillus sp. Marseille-Q4541]|uniref:ABC transporter ATP-binding protein n=1 Tax=Paenibacillus sp. Marseille-Q4541 TaxID=2831522 RepID=UPI001BAD07BF